MLSSARQAVVEYLRDVWDYRFFWLSLVKADLQRRYRRSVLGLGWSLLQPICMTVVLGVVYHNMFKMNFWTLAPYLLSGLAFWGLISTVVTLGCGSLVGAESYIRQQSVPLVIFPLRTVLTMGFHFLLSLGLAVVFTGCVHGFARPLALVSLVPTVLLLFVFGWALSTVAAFSHVYFPDTQHLAEVGLQALMFLTPIMYPPSMLHNNRFGWLLQLNPLGTVLQLLREPIIDGRFPSLALYGHAALIVAVPLAVAVFLVARLERRLIFAL